MPDFQDKNPNDTANFTADNKICFSCFNGEHVFRDCTRGLKCSQDGCKSAHHSLLHGTEKLFPSKAKQTKKSAVTDKGDKVPEAHKITQPQLEVFVQL